MRKKTFGSHFLEIIIGFYLNCFDIQLFYIEMNFTFDDNINEIESELNMLIMHIKINLQII
jgi:hypothetical protein